MFSSAYNGDMAFYIDEELHHRTGIHHLALKLRASFWTSGGLDRDGEICYLVRSWTRLEFLSKKYHSELEGLALINYEKINSENLKNY